MLGRIAFKRITLFQKNRWWGKQDSNLRRLSQRIYSPPPLPLGTFPHPGSGKAKARRRLTGFRRGKAWAVVMGSGRRPVNGQRDNWQEIDAARPPVKSWGMRSPSPRPAFRPKPRHVRHGSWEGRHDVQLIWGVHAVEAALANPARRLRRIFASENGWHRVEAVAAGRIKPEIMRPQEIDRLLPADAVHQGLLLEADPLPVLDVEAVPETGIVLALDQVTDPHNVGAILRSAAAFGVTTLMMTNRHSPEATGVLAKAASGALELVPFCLVRNLRQGLASLAARGFTRLGLDSDAENDITTLPLKAPLVLVLGAEGKGLRAGTSEDCDILARIALPGKLTSLNVSNAAAVALFATHQRLALSA